MRNSLDKKVVGMVLVALLSVYAIGVAPVHAEDTVSDVSDASTEALMLVLIELIQTLQAQIELLLEQQSNSSLPPVDVETEYMEIDDHVDDLTDEPHDIFVVTEPDEGDWYTQGDILTIYWVREEPGVETIRVIPLDGHAIYQIYSKKVYDYPINKDGKFSYKIPDSWKPGPYYVEISSPSYGPEYLDESGVFTVKEKSNYDQELKITKPKGGESYEAGDIIHIRWDPETPGVETIRIVPSPGWNNEGATIYSKKVYDYPINKTGRFDYTLPQYHFGDGSYYIEISSPSFGDDHIDTSGAIYIVGDDVAALNAAHGDRQMAGALAGVEGVIDMLSAFLGQ